LLVYFRTMQELQALPKEGRFLKNAMNTRLDLKQVAALYHVQPDAIKKRVRKGRFPKPITGPREKMIWLLEHIEEWERGRLEDPLTKKLDEAVQESKRQYVRQRRTEMTLRRFGLIVGA